MSLIIGSSLPETLIKRAATAPQKTALLRKKSGVWHSHSWSEVKFKVFEIAHSLKLSGVKPGDVVAILAQTRVEWFYCDLAIMSLGAVTVPIYSAVTADDVHYILNDSKAKFVFVEDNVQLQKVENVSAQLKKNVQIVSFERTQEDKALSLDVWAESLLRNSLDNLNEIQANWELSASTVPSEGLATIVYTSGTMGTPKGVELTHGNFLSILSGLSQALELSERDTTMLFLPAAHIMGRVEQMMSVAIGLTNAYCESLSSLIDNMIEIKPTILVSVPRVYEKLYASIQHKFNGESIVVREGFKLALMIGGEHSRCLQKGETPDPFLKMKYLAADKLYFSKVRERLGGRLRFCLSGGASLASEVAEFFHACGLLVLEGYGLTESTGPACLNRPDAFKFGSVGKPLPGCELRLAEDHEILLRGPMISSAYHNLPKETQESFLGDWFATGDVGQIDESGFLQIVDRKKDIIVTSGGKNIAPMKIVNHFKADPLFSHVVVVGDKRQFLVALITLNPAEAKRVAESLGLNKELVALQKSDSLDNWIENERFYEAIAKRVEAQNAGLASYESIRRFRLLPRDLSIEAGELTPSLKIRRSFCEEKYSRLIAQMYPEPYRT